MKLSLVLPCYNEEKNIPTIVTRIRDVLSDRQDVEVILINNGSTDQSAAIIAAQLAAVGDARITSCHVPENKGYGYGIMFGLEQTTGDVLSWTHADMQTDPKDVLRAFDAYKQQDNERIVFKGKRQNRTFLEMVFTFGMQLVASAALGMMLDDINAQPKLFSREFFNHHLRRQAPDDFSLDLFLLYQAHTYGHKLMTIPVIFAKRRYGEAKGGGSWKTRIKLVRRTFAYIFKLRSQLKLQAPA